jgi:uncharacterized membrane protein
MGKGRLEAFTDGVVAIVITIMVLEIKVPSGAGLADLAANVPILLTYALSYLQVGIFWNNHHHMLHATARVNGAVLWANLFLLFWISLVPLTIRWIDEAGFAPWPVACYGIVLALASVAYILLEWAIIACNGRHSALARALGHEVKGKLSLALWLAGVGMSFVHPFAALAIYVATALLWLVPDRRIETLKEP